MGVREPEAKAIASTSAPAPPTEPVHRRKIAKGPNPLSVKKKKKVATPGSDAAQQQAKQDTPNTGSQKRVRDTSDDEKDTPASKLEGSGGHKRKRRRKQADVPSA